MIVDGRCDVARCKDYADIGYIVHSDDCKRKENVAAGTQGVISCGCTKIELCDRHWTQLSDIVESDMPFAEKVAAHRAYLLKVAKRVERAANGERDDDSD
jgi:hypothetical protein